MIDEETIEACREWLAARKAWVDQKEKQFEDQYPMVSPPLNRMRFDDLEIWKFQIEINEWELEQFINAQEMESHES